MVVGGGGGGGEAFANYKVRDLDQVTTKLN